MVAFKKKIPAPLDRLKEEMMIFLSEKNSLLEAFFHDQEWLSKLCYLADIFEKLNDLNISLQRENSYVLTQKDKVNGFLRKLQLWINLAESSKFVMFPYLNDFIENQEMDIELIKSSISDHLNSLKNNFLKYFLSDVDTSRFDWVQNPVAASADTVQHLPVKAQEEFTDLSTDTQLKQKFQKQPLSSFWRDIKSEFPLLADLAIGILLPFASTYAYEAAFSAVKTLKNKNRCALKSVEMVLRTALTTIEPMLDEILKK